MKLQFPNVKGWQLARVTLVPVEARTWAKKSWDSICLESERRFSSCHAGRMSLNSPGSDRDPYQATPNPSALVATTDSRAEKLWCTSEYFGLKMTSSSGRRGPE